MSSKIISLSLQEKTSDWSFKKKFSPVTDNAYRYLGLPASASQTEIDQAVAALQRAFKLETIRSKKTDLDWLGKLNRTENKMNAVLSRLSNPQQRIRERLFWFHELQEIAPPDSPEAFINELRKHLSPGQVTAKQTNALLSLAVCYSFDPDFNYPKIWLEMLTLWREVADDDEFWRYFRGLDLSGNFERAAVPSEIKALRGQTMELMLEAVAETVYPFLKNNRLTRAQRVFEAVRAAGLPESDIFFFETHALGEFEEQYARRCAEEFEGDWLNSDSVRNTILPYLKALLLLTGPRSEMTRRLLTVSAAHFLSFAQHYPTEKESQIRIFREFLKAATVLAPPESYIYNEIEDYIRENNINLKMPTFNKGKENHLPAHYLMVMNDLKSTVASFLPQNNYYPQMISNENVPPPGNGTDLFDRIFSVMGRLFVIGIFLGLAFLCRLARTTNKYSPPRDNIPQLVRNMPINVSVPPINLDKSGWIESIWVDELRDLKKRAAVIIVDAGTVREYRNGHIPEAILYSEKSENQIIEEYQKSGKTVVVYNHNSKKDTDHEVARKLHEQGVTDIKIFFGGYEMWRMWRKDSGPIMPPTSLDMPLTSPDMPVRTK